jgi:hypothetical protein
MARGRADRPRDRAVVPTGHRAGAGQSAGARVRLALVPGCADGSAPAVAPVGPAGTEALTSLCRLCGLAQACCSDAHFVRPTLGPASPRGVCLAATTKQQQRSPARDQPEDDRKTFPHQVSQSELRGACLLRVTLGLSLTGHRQTTRGASPRRDSGPLRGLTRACSTSIRSHCARRCRISPRLQSRFPGARRRQTNSGCPETGAGRSPPRPEGAPRARHSWPSPI